ncbi:hypothetical protein OHS59_17785 [Streptomyces sp. NBC_00414]|uniref:hypothetical protein n=1 Tax=Streptomyces sp. NBC_00414 TaxID=2975739 RepID=UPI002E220FA7
MGDERCVFPGENPRPPGRWLDRDAAERLLRGEPLEAVDADIRGQADRLAEALGSLGALSAETAPNSAELPGEDAALAAFRTARSGRSEEAALAGAARTRSSAPFPSQRASPDFLDAGLVQIRRSDTDRRAPSLWGRPVRYGFAAALAAGMIGGVAVAATAGVLAFGGGEPEPGASATAAVTPDRPLVTPSPGETRGGDDPRPEGSAGAPTGESSAPSGEAHGNTGTGAQPDSDETRREDRPGTRWAKIASACRDYRDGKELDAGRRRTLEDAARGAEQVQKYCRAILKDRNRHDSGDDWSDPRSGRGDAGKGGSGNGNGDDRGGDYGGGDGGDGGGHGGDDRGHTGTFRSEDDAAAPAPRISTLDEPLASVPSRVLSP